MKENTKALLLKGLKELGCEVAKMCGYKMVQVATTIQQDGKPQPLVGPNTLPSTPHDWRPKMTSDVVIAKTPDTYVSDGAATDPARQVRFESN